MEEVVDWLNINSGLVQVILFLITLFVAWVSGFFKFIRKKAKLSWKIFLGPTMCSEIETGKISNNEPIKRAIFSIYLRISNIGRQDISIYNIKIRYRTNYLKFQNNFIWKRFSEYEYKIEHINFLYKWSPKLNLCTIYAPFQFKLNEQQFKEYPLLIQGNFNIPSVDLFLEIGKTASGIVYFESEKYWGGFRPKPINDKIAVKIYLKDSFNKIHHHKCYIGYKSIEESRKFNSEFGKTLLDSD